MSFNEIMDGERIRIQEEHILILQEGLEKARKRIAELEEMNTLLKEIEVEHGNAFREVALLSEAQRARIAELETLLSIRADRLDNLEDDLQDTWQQYRARFIDAGNRIVTGDANGDDFEPLICQFAEFARDNNS